MELLGDLPLRFSRLPMFPFFDLAHYTASILSLKEQRGVVEVAYGSPLACWFSAMLYCFGGSILSSLMLAEPLIAFLANTTGVLLASSVWYLIFYCPRDLAYRCLCFPPIRLMIAGMKEVTRTWKITGGIVHAHKRFADAWLIMIGVGWARGAGGGLISNFEQLVRGVWKPETNELLKMSYPVKVSLMGAVLFTMQCNFYLPITKHNLMLLYTLFLVITKINMMVTGCTTSPFASLEEPLARLFFGQKPTGSQAMDEIKGPLNGISSACDCLLDGEKSEAVQKKQAKKAQ
ncbi:trimeric intracellular cation channel type B isoform X1 [Crotalus tigris]|uniref:trimeric intracellular cation channel type B isoform X1 n=2 Tax=Crotalus tigris TaxID=88082 RepID=UPI00192F7237|nr:trimeric intracellular cation channel type B isoform X1 [Crotalus tigris]